jgi:hypothetical protein
MVILLFAFVDAKIHTSCSVSKGMFLKRRRISPKDTRDSPTAPSGSRAKKTMLLY